MSRVFTFDLETTITDGDPRACLDHNQAILIGWKNDGDSTNTQKWEHVMRAYQITPPSVVVGHNLMFDLAYLLRDNKLDDFVYNPNILLWDTMIVEYLMSGCSVPSPKLESCCDRAGIGYRKSPLITKYFDEGKGADIIMADGYEKELRSYLCGDVDATYNLYVDQVTRLKQRYSSALPVVLTQLNALRLSVIAQHTGLKFDPTELAAASMIADADAVRLEGDIKQKIRSVAKDHADEVAEQFNPGSPTQVLSLLTNNTLSVTLDKHTGRFYKSGKRVGQPVTKKENELVSVPLGHAFVNEKSADEKTLRYCAAEAHGTLLAALLLDILALRKNKKLISTYYIPITEYIATSFDGRVHGNINMAVTNTGRKSSSKPNQQNMPSEVQKLVRPPPGYKIMTADFKQIEVVIMAYLSGDINLTKTILRGESLHDNVRATLKSKYGLDVSARDVKSINFGRFYGGGIDTLAGQSGVPRNVVARVIKTLDSLYPSVAGMWRDVETVLNKAKQPLTISGSPHQEYQGWYQLPTGRWLKFLTKRGKWQVPDMKNRRVQSMATADLVPLAEDMIVRVMLQGEWLQKGYVMPFNVVHDEIDFYVRQDKVKDWERELRKIEARIRSVMNKRFGLNPPLDLPIKISIGAGNNWKEAKDNA